VFSRVPILSYHAIVAEDQKPAPAWSAYHAVSLAAFREQLNFLSEGAWRVVALRALEQASVPRKSVAITFDDGGSSDLVAAEELFGRGMPAAFFVTWSRLGCRWYLTRGQVIELDRQGFTIGSHGLAHVRFGELSPEELRDQLVGSRERLECLLGKPVMALALPYGSYRDEVVSAAVAAGYRSIMTSDFALAVAGNNVLPRLSIAAGTTLQDFNALLTDSPMGIARRRVLNGIRRRWKRLQSMASGRR
jgi:peptidoglycan/xylan/chitin deacetylase (PgdA/CDA1 family)